MSGKRNTYHLIEAKCPICGKTFYPTPEHAYRDKRSPYKKVCSWGCVRKSERLKEANKQRNSRKRVV